MPYKILKTILLAFIIILPLQSKAEISLDVSIGEPVAVAPPPLPVYVVPEPPAEDFVWAPGHWQWGEYGYFWVPGTWVEPPQVGLLWTPGYWAYDQDRFFFHEGYWGPHVGFYGGINYGGGYNGRGFDGGGWRGDHYEVNRSVTNNINNNVTINNHRQSFNGGPGGTSIRPTASQQSFARENHYPPTEEQVQHRDAALNNPQLRQDANHGRPPIAASTTPGDFSGRGTVAARGAGRVNQQSQNFNERGNTQTNRPEVSKPNQSFERSDFHQPNHAVGAPVTQQPAAQTQSRENFSNAYSPHSRPAELPQHHQSDRYAAPQNAPREREAQPAHQAQRSPEHESKDREQR